MQHDEHVWRWRQWRFHMTGLYAWFTSRTIYLS